MSSDESKLVDSLRPASQDEIREILGEITKVDMARPLVELFEREGNKAKYMVPKRPETGYKRILSDPKADVYASLYLSKNRDDCAELTIHHEPINRIYSVSMSYMVSVLARPIDKGIWAHTKGNLVSQGIEINVSKSRRGIILPSKEWRWCLGLMNWLSVRAEEFYEEFSKKQGFWDGAEGHDR